MFNVFLTLILLSVTALAVFFQFRVIGKNAKLAEERRARGEPQPSTVWRRVLILLAAGVILAITIFLSTR